MTRKLSATATLTWLLLALGGTAHASEEVSVGRIDMQLPGEGWQSQSLPDRGTTLSGGGLTRQQQAETKVLVRRAPDQTIDVVFIVRANATGKGRFSGVRFHDLRCEGPAGAFVEGDPPSSAASSYRCLYVTHAGTVGDPATFFQQMQHELDAASWKLAPTMHLMVARQYANSGAYVDFTVLVAPHALPAQSRASAQTADPLPAGVSMASVQWGRLLQKAVTDSVYSIRGKLPVPELLPAGAPSPSN